MKTPFREPLSSGLLENQYDCHAIWYVEITNYYKRNKNIDRCLMGD